MAITNGYATLDEVKTRLGICDVTNDDTALEYIVEAASRWIDQNRGRRFYAASETRYYTPESDQFCIIDDLLSLTTLETDDNGDGTYETTWNSTDYILHPRNASLDGKPYMQIRKTPLSGYYFYPSVCDGVKVTGSFGYSSTTPDAVKEACILASMRIWRRKDLIFGIAGNADLGTVEAIVNLKRDGELMGLLSTIPRRMYYGYYK